MEILDFTYRTIAIVLLLARRGVWHYTGKATEKKQPITQFKFDWTSYRSLNKLATRLFSVFVLLQLAGLRIFPIYENHILFQSVGIVVAFVGFFIGVAARLQLGENWAHAADYQVKTHQKLITTGVYSHIRHPIYAGLSLLLVGSELVALSWLFLPTAIILFGSAYLQAKKEEVILRESFGQKFDDYKKRTRMLIPFFV